MQQPTEISQKSTIESAIEPTHHESAKSIERMGSSGVIEGVQQRKEEESVIDWKEEARKKDLIIKEQEKKISMLKSQLVSYKKEVGLYFPPLFG